METEGKTVFHHPPRVVSFGEILFDVIEGVPCLGGAPLNLAVHLHRQGAETTLISAVGADPLGRSALKQIQEFGLDTGSIAVLEKFPTGTVTVSLDERKVASYQFASDTAYDHIPVPEFKGEVDLLCFGTLAQRSEESRTALARLRKSMDCLFFYDVNLRQNFYSKEIVGESLESADVVKLNEEDDLYAEGRIIHSPAYPVKVVSTVGAGDSFSAAFLYRWLTGETLEKALEAGNRLAAEVAGHKGAV